MSLIKQLTAEQVEDLARTLDEWISHGLCTAPTDRPAAEAALHLVYGLAGLPPPRQKIWLRSPLEGALATALMSSALAPAQVWPQVWDQVRAQVWPQVWDQVRAQVWSQVGTQVWSQVGAHVWDQVWDQVGTQVRDQLVPPFFGAHEAGWLSPYDFFALHFERAKKSAGLRALATSCGWCWAFDQGAILTERPSSLCFDDAGRLHASHSPAVAYPDGFCVYVYKGVRMPADVMQNRSLITVERIDGEGNAECRRVLIELFGIDRYMREAGGEQRDHDNRWGTLWRRHLPEGTMQVLECVNGTPEPDGSTKRYWLPVPPDVETALEAVAWTYDMSPDEYARLEIRT